MRQLSELPVPNIPGELIKAGISPAWAESLPTALDQVNENGQETLPDDFDPKLLRNLAGCSLWLAQGLVCSNDIDDLKYEGTVVDLSLGDTFPLLADNLMVIHGVKYSLNVDNPLTKKVREFNKTCRQRNIKAYWLLSRSGVNHFEYYYDLNFELSHYQIRRKHFRNISLPKPTVGAKDAFDSAVHLVES